MSSKRKEKKRSKVLTQYPCLPPQKKPIFLTPLRNIPKIKVAVTVNPLRNHFESPSPQQKILSIVVGGTGSGYLNGIDQNSFMVRGITNLIVLVSLKKTTTTQKIVGG